jgi:Spy/CpxP family protein refolding chaperone
MHRQLFPVVALCAVTASASFGQTPYAGQQARPIKALSDQQVADLQAGRGMGLALAAELNGYPGPSHLLELASQLGLSDDQRRRIQGLFDAMKAETIPIGERLISEEKTLDAMFATHTATPAAIATATAAIGDTQARLRAAHLKYHLSTVELLQPEQVQRYAELRGYGSGGGTPHHHPR